MLIKAKRIYLKPFGKSSTCFRSKDSRTSFAKAEIIKIGLES